MVLIRGALVVILRALVMVAGREVAHLLFFFVVFSMEDLLLFLLSFSLEIFLLLIGAVALFFVSGFLRLGTGSLLLSLQLIDVVIRLSFLDVFIELAVFGEPSELIHFFFRAFSFHVFTAPQHATFSLLCQLIGNVSGLLLAFFGCGFGTTSIGDGH